MLKAKPAKNALQPKAYIAKHSISPIHIFNEFYKLFLVPVYQLILLSMVSIVDPAT